MSKKTNTLLASAVAAGILMMGAEAANAASKAKAADPAGAIESRLKMMEDQMNAMKSELSRVRAESASSAKVADLEQKVANQASAAKKQKEHTNLLFFRGGYPRMEHSRSGELLAGGVANGNAGALGSRGHDNGDGWYVGAGFDFHLTEDVWGLTDQAEVFGELMFDYKHLGQSQNSAVTFVTGAPTPLGNVGTGGAGNVTTIKNQVTMFTLSASPKIKFMPHSDFRPWIIPVGLAINVISPPSSGVTVLNPGLMTGAGAEYKIWKDMYAGADFRYQFTGNDLKAHDSAHLIKGTGTNGFTTGAYVGIGF